MALNTVQPDLVRFELRMAQGQPADFREQKKPGAFSRFLSGFGKVLGSLAMPLSFIFPPAAIGAAGMYGVGAIGDQMQAKTYAKQAEKAQREAATNVVFPGLDIGQPSPIQPASFDLSARDQEVMSILAPRGNVTTRMAHSI